MLGLKNNIVLIALGILLAAPAGRAQVGGKITGVVKDQTDSVIAGATVVAVNTVSGVKQTTETDERGTYTFPALPVAQYELDVTADGFKPTKTRGLAIDINTALTVDVTLQVGDQNLTVTVTENAAPGRNLRYATRRGH